MLVEIMIITYGIHIFSCVQVQEVLRRSMSCNPEDAHHNRMNLRRASKHAQMQKLFAGDLQDLPQIPSKTIRIFLSSTFSGQMWQVFII